MFVDKKGGVNKQTQSISNIGRNDILVYTDSLSHKSQVVTDPSKDTLLSHLLCERRGRYDLIKVKGLSEN